ncbi:DUF4304 domain-containing protein [Campylobacter curvus]|uniref:DUF4304 domain-containing protein n=1 Tax=Campylobacter sp. TaxID=205 RepID=UPI0014700524|nr:DUF4304 domain-containing protein [Campylobacter curvus]
MFTINFQKSSANSPFETKFYINCGVMRRFLTPRLVKMHLFTPKNMSVILERGFRLSLKKMTDTLSIKIPI